MGRSGSGVEARQNSIRISFTLDGQQRRETLKTDGKPLAPTPANLKYAHRLAAEIRQKIRYGSFIYAEYFPASRNATTGQGATVSDRLDVWIEAQVGKEASTLKGYRTALRWWNGQIGAKLARSLVKSDILAALASEPTWTGKTRNNKLSVLRQALQLAVEDGVLHTNPTDHIGAFEHQRPEPDPFTLEEADTIIAALAGVDEQVSRYFAVKFFTGLRTSESLALRWDWIDWKRGTMAVSGAVVLGQTKDRTKTHTIRHVQLNSRALDALKRQKAATFLQPHGLIFPDPRTGERWTDDEPPRELYWRPCLRRLGMRYRSPYETRHTYATMMLMQAVTPAFAARQMGHSIEMFLRTYARWIDGGQNAIEMAKLEGLLASPVETRAIG